MDTELARRKLILGLGNPGEQYRGTRHNLGFRVVKELARRRGIDLRMGECRSFFGWDDTVALAVPQTYMNRSGYAARCLIERRGFTPEQILVVFDDVNLPLGRLRLRRGGSPGGHRGMESVIENLRTDQVPRLRLGIRPKAAPLASLELVEFVLQPFTKEELPEVEELIVRSADACEVWIAAGTEAGMNQING